MWTEDQNGQKFGTEDRPKEVMFGLDQTEWTSFWSSPDLDRKLQFPNKKLRRGHITDVVTSFTRSVSSHVINRHTIFVTTMTL